MQGHATSDSQQDSKPGKTDLRRRTGRFQMTEGTTEPIVNYRLLVEKELEHQQEIFHVFIDFKKAFDRAWHEGL